MGGGEIPVTRGTNFGELGPVGTLFHFSVGSKLQTKIKHNFYVYRFAMNRQKLEAYMLRCPPYVPGGGTRGADRRAHLHVSLSLTSRIYNKVKVTPRHRVMHKSVRQMADSWFSVREDE